MEQKINRNNLIFGLAYNGLRFAGPGALICLFYLQGTLRFSPDQWVEILVFLAWAFPVFTAFNVGTAFLFIRRPYKVLGEIGSGAAPDPQTVIRTLQDLFSFTTYSSIFSAMMWALGGFGLSAWLWSKGEITLGDTLLIVIAGVFLGPITSLLYYFTARRRLIPIQSQLSRYLPPGTEVSIAGVSLRIRMLLSIVFVILMIGTSGTVMIFRLQSEHLTELGLKEARTRIGQLGSPAIEQQARQKALIPLVLDGLVLRPFVMDRSGKLLGGQISSAEVEYLRDSPRGLAKEKFRSQHPIRATIARYVAELIPESDHFNTTVLDRPVTVVLSSDSKGAGFVGSMLETNLQHNPGLSQGWVVFFNQQAVLLILYIVTGFITAIILIVLLTEDVMRPVQGLRAAAAAFHGGAGDSRFEMIADDEVGRLISDFNRMAVRWSEQVQDAAKTVKSLEEIVQHLSLAATEIVSIATEQASGATEQAASIQQVSTTSEQIAATLKVISENARSVEEVAGKTLYSCQVGQQDIQSVLESMMGVTGRVQAIAEKMLEFENRARDIESVVELIHDVSEKTNMISLNASIESAAQGEAGVRFAIIAAEVRDLAERTVEATREIRGMVESLEQSTSSVIIATEEGTKQVQSSEKKMEKVSDSFQQIIHLASETARSAQEIAISSSQQTSAGEHLAATIAEINEVAKNFVESASQIERNTAELNRMAEHLREIISREG